MSLSAANGPLSSQPAGRLNAELDRSRTLRYVHELPYRVRGLFAGETVIDADRPLLVHEQDRLPVFHFREADVRRDLLEPEGEQDGVHRFALRVGDRVAPNAGWTYGESCDRLLQGLYTFAWEALDEWFGEDEQLHGHPRDPFSRIDVFPTTRHVRISLDGELLADSRRACVLVETGLPPRYYLPPEDVRMDLLESSTTRTRCAYKGSASYWSARVVGRLVDDLAWSYPEPQHDAEPVRGLVCFFNERVDLEVEGRRLERPRTQWSRE